MSESRALQVAELMKSALERDPRERSSFLDEKCGSDAALRAEVESLLRFEQSTPGFMQQPAVELAAHLLVGSRELKPEETIGGYQILSLIGRGGMGDVYLALDLQLGRKVALKIIRHGLDTEGLNRRFLREEQILASLNHPNIAALYGAAVSADSVPYLVMEYVEGKCLDDYCNGRSLTTNERLDIFRKICAAVAYAHQHIVIHRDLKPANIRVTPDGVPKLLDFGIARLLDAETSRTSGQTITLAKVMTPDYASPEQVRGETMTTASDVYSLGVVLYELLTGCRPYRTNGRTPDDIVNAVLVDDPESPSTALARNKTSNVEHRTSKVLRGDLDNIVLMAMRKEPERRYTSVSQFSGDIGRYLDGLPVIARKDTWSYRAGKFVRRNKIAVTASVLIALTLLGAVFVTTRQAKLASQQRDLAQREKSKAESINQFLHRMLSFSNQSIDSVSPVAQKKDVTVNAMLDQITPQVETELADQPEVRAKVLRTIGSAYASQGQYDAAEKNLRSALEAQRQFYGDENPEVAATEAELGVLYFRQVKLEEANRLLERAVAFYRRQQQTKSPEFRPAKLAHVLDNLGLTKLGRGDSKSGMLLLNEALQVAAAANLSGNERAVLASIKTDLGGILVMSGGLERGESLLRESLAQFRRASSQPRWEIGATLTMLGLCELHKQQPDEAEKFLLEGERIYRGTLGDKNLYLAFNLEGQAAASSQKNDFETAVKKGHEALTLTLEIFPNNKLAWISALGTFGDLLTAAGHAREGEDYLRQALTICEQQTSPDLSSVAKLKISLSQSLLAQNELAEAEKIASEAYDETKVSFGEKSLMLKPAANNLIMIYEKEGKHAAAEKLK